MNMDLISVIIPVYNTAEYLPRCLDSVLNNTYRNLEVICINDGSTDNSAEILQQYAQQDSRIVIITQENAGVSAARNAGLDRATGDFVAFIDSDDWVQLSSFERFIGSQKKYDADIVACNFMKSYGDELIESMLVCEEQLLNVQDVLHNAQLKRVVWGKMYRRELLRMVRFDVTLAYGEDTTFNLLLFAQYPLLRVVQIVDALYVYFGRGGSLSDTASWQKQHQLISWLLEHYKMGQKPYVQKMFLEQASKDTLASRYGAMVTDEKDVCASCDNLMQICWKELKESNLFSSRELVLLRCFIKMPFAYRIFRIINDPTLLMWEKNVKARQQTNMKNKQ